MKAAIFSLIKVIQLRFYVFAPLVLFTILTVAIYGQSLRYEFFIFDDAFHITDNSRFNPVTLSNIIWFWSHSLMSVTYTIWGVIAATFGVRDPIPFRVFNIILHLVNTYLVFKWIQIALPLIVRKTEIQVRQISMASLFGALIFLVHPVHVEPVVWISSAKDLLSCFFGLISLHLYWRCRQSNENVRLRYFQIGMYSALIASVLSKVSSLILILMFIWIDRLIFKRNIRNMVIEYLPLFLLSGIVLLVYHRLVPTDYLGFVPGYGWRVFIALDSLLFNLTKLFMPYEYYFDYGRTPLTVIKTALASPFLSITVVLSMTMFLVGIIFTYPVKRNRILHYSFGFMILTMVPSIGLIPFVHQNISTTADRYLYLPSVGFSILVAALYLRFGHGRLATLLLLVLTFVLAIKSYRQTSVWRDSVICLSYSVSKYPLSHVSHTALGEALRKKKWTEEAEKHLSIGRVLLAEERTGLN